MNTPAKKIFLIDGSSYLYRAFHAMPPLTTSSGLPTGAVKGVTNMLRNLRKENPDSYYLSIFDAKGKNFRHDIYKDYKANRPPMPEDLREQLSPLKEIFLLIKSVAQALIIFTTLSRSVISANSILLIKNKYV